MHYRNLLMSLLLLAALFPFSAAALNLIEIADDLGDVKHLSNINGDFFYHADDALFKIDPVYNAGTLTGFAIITITVSAEGISHWGLTDASSPTVTNFLYATHNEFTGAGALWRCNGTPGGVVQIEGLAHRITGITHLGSGTILFANDSGPGTDSTLYLTDGSVSGAVSIASGLGGQIRGLTTVGTNAFFTLYDNTSEEYELWVTDGTGTGTKNLTPPGGFPDLISYWYLTDVGGVVYFPVGFEGNFQGDEPQSDFVLWKSDGTVSGTVPVTATLGLEIPINFRVQKNSGIGRYLWFSTFSNRDDDYGGEIFRLDTTTDTLKIVKGGLDTVYSSDMAVANETNVYFAEYNEVLDISTIWISDGTPAGTFIFLDNLEEVHDLTCIGGILYYAAYHFDSGINDVKAASRCSLLADAKLNDPPLVGTWTGKLLGLDQTGVTYSKVSLGSALPITPSHVGQLPGTQFSKKPSVWSLFRDRVKSIDAKNQKVSWKIANKISANAPVDTAMAEWTKTFLLYSKKAVKGLTAANLPALAPARINDLNILAKELSPSVYEFTNVFLLVPPAIVTIKDDLGGVIAAPQEGDVLVVVGTFFGAKPPKLYVECNPKGDGVLTRKACTLVNTKVTPPLFMNAAGTPNTSYMKVRADDPAAGTVGDSEARYLYPKGIVNPTGWFILDNQIGLATWQQP